MNIADNEQLSDTDLTTQLMATVDELSEVNERFTHKPGIDSLQARFNLMTVQAIKQMATIIANLVDDADPLANLQEHIDNLGDRDRAKLQAWLQTRYGRESN